MNCFFLATNHRTEIATSPPTTTNYSANIELCTDLQLVTKYLLPGVLDRASFVVSSKPFH